MQENLFCIHSHVEYTSSLYGIDSASLVIESFVQPYVISLTYVDLPRCSVNNNLNFSLFPAQSYCISQKTWSV